MPKTALKNSDGSKHIHSLERVAEKDIRKEIRYHCTHPDCGHVIQRRLVKGKRTLCGICHLAETTMDYENMRRAIPRCVKCSTTKRAEAIQEKMGILEDIFEISESGVKSE